MTTSDKPWSVVEAASTTSSGSAIIFSLANSDRGVDSAMWAAQSEVVRKLTPNGCTHWQIAGPHFHPVHIDKLTANLRSAIEGLRLQGDDEAAEKVLDTVFVLLDMDCVPVNRATIPTLIAEAQNGALVGHAQRSNHLSNGEHIFVAPACVAMTLRTMENMGWPSAAITERSDTCEEWSWIAEERAIPIRLFKPLHFEFLPYRAKSPWQLNDELGDYGIGTSFGTASGEPLTWHCFQLASPAEPFLDWGRRVASAVKHRRRQILRRERSFDRSEYVVNRMNQFARSIAEKSG